MSAREPGWTVDTYAAHNEALRKAEAKFQSERDRRWKERDKANKAAVRAALNAAEKASEKTELALKEYKAGANEWRDTVKDLIAHQTGESQGMSSLWGLGIGAAALMASLIAIGTFVFARPAVVPTTAPQIIYVPAPSGTLLPSTPPQPQPATR